MKPKIEDLIIKLLTERKLERFEYERLIEERDADSAERLRIEAEKIRKRYYGNTVYIRGLIEISNVCKNDCLYCGIRSSNKKCSRYRLSPEEIIGCCEEGYALGFRTFVLQGGEDPFYTDDILCHIIKGIKSKFSDAAVTLSLGERSFESYAALKSAGADRYLLRHETADENHYRKLHPQNMSFDNRIRCLLELKRLGYQVGCGFMVGSPYQSAFELSKDLKFIEEFEPHMCGIGPFIPQSDTPFGDRKAGTAELTYYLISIIRLIHPNLLIPATTALGTIAENGRELGILSGANVVMPNLSPSSVRSKYNLYNNKIYDGSESAQCLEELKNRMNSIGYNVVVDRGDVKSI